jgi:hypothetical protein
VGFTIDGNLLEDRAKLPTTEGTLGSVFNVRHRVIGKVSDQGGNCPFFNFRQGR